MTPQQIEALKLALEALEIEEAQTHYPSQFLLRAITAIKEALAEHAMRETQRLGQEIEQEPVAMRMPKVGDEVVCIEDNSLGTVEYLTAGGSPEIKFDDGSHGTYLLREFAELFRYATPPQRTWVGLTEQEHTDIAVECGCMSADWVFYGAAVERKLKEKNT